VLAIIKPRADTPVTAERIRVIVQQFWAFWRKRDEQGAHVTTIGWRIGEAAADGVGMGTSMILLLSVTEADCLGRQHCRVRGATNRHQRRRGAYRASGLVHRPQAVLPCALENLASVNRRRSAFRR